MNNKDKSLMKPTNASTSQLLPNRGILTKINAVVRKKSHERNVQMPPEWDVNTAQAYRLLVGPSISEYITPESVGAGDFDQQDPIDDQAYHKHARFFEKLHASRLKDPGQTLTVKRADVSFDALHFPADLLMQVFPPDSIKKFDLLDLRNSKRKTHKIVRPTVHSLSFSRNSSSLLPSRQSTNRSLGSLADVDSNADKEEEEEEEKNDDENINNEKSAENPNDESQRVQVASTVPKGPESFLLSRSARARLKDVIKLRTYFYVIRCWAHYNMNARIKADFVVDIHHTQIELHVFQTWHIYVKTVKRLRLCKAECIRKLTMQIQLRCYSHWKTKAAKAIRNAEAASGALVLFDSLLQRRMFQCFREGAHSRRICRRETLKKFRYEHKGPFTPINSFYTEKRTNTVRALHFHFMRSVPPMIRAWRSIVKRTRRDNDHTDQLYLIRRRSYFNEWFEIYKDHFHQRQMAEVRRISLLKLAKLEKSEQDSAENIEKTVMMQLVRDRNVLNAKLNQFDRLSQNHHEAVLRRKQMRQDIANTTNDFFRRQEELQLIDHQKQANEVERKTREVRIQLAEGFLYHLKRAVRSYDNQVIAHQFCIAFRVISEPIVQKAVGYFYEKRHLKALVASASRERLALRSIVGCTTLYHQNQGWQWWRKFINMTNAGRTEGIMLTIRRRTQILQLYPYFNWTEVLPVRPPRPLKEVEQMFKDLPLVSIQRKVARERVHHVNVRTMLMRRRILRDFLRAYAAFVQTQIATREVMKLLRKKQSLRLVRNVFDAFQANAKHAPLELQTTDEEVEINSNVLAWERHFFRARNKQTRIVRSLPLS